MLHVHFRAVALLFAVVLTVSSGPARTAQPDSLNVYIDADFSVAPIVGEAIELGLLTALAEVDGRVAGLPVTVQRMDHRTNSRRSQRNFKQFLNDPNAIAMFGGKQSPPYLSYGDQINAYGVPLLLAWSAAAPITRLATGSGNFIFRLSVDDKQAGPFLVEQALQDGCHDVALLLVDTGWGRANLRTITAALEARQLVPTAVIMVPNDIGKAAARNVARDLANSKAQCSLAVLTTDTGSTVLAALSEMEVDIDVFSHWGIFGQRFPVNVPFEMRESLNLRVLHTCGLSIEQAGSPVLANALERANEINGQILRLADISAPAGFVHGYDLGRIFLAAAEQAATTAEWSDSPIARRAALRNALAELEQPIDGIMTRYAPPFSDLTESNPDGHEALGQESLCLAVFDEENHLVPATERE